MRLLTSRPTGVVALLVLLCMGLLPGAAGSTNAARAQSPYGGTLTATTGTDLGDLDPAISYSWEDYNMLHEVFNGLLGYKPGTTTLVPDIATSFPQVSKDGLTWTFTLRKGVMFQPPVSREVVAADFKYSWERVLNPKTASPGVTFFLHIAEA